jgi:acyl-CoA reductase-like NAD-dependent aldehyde dehydrogenase
MMKIYNFINGDFYYKEKPLWVEKYNPVDDKLQSTFVCSNIDDVAMAIESASSGFNIWSKLTSIKRGEYLRIFTNLLRENAENLAEIVAFETGKSIKDALGEVNASIMQGDFFASEGMRLYSKTLVSGTENKYTNSTRVPLGVAALIVPANTPIANIAWKMFPALICGNSVILKSSEDAPLIANRIAEISKLAKLPNGVFNVLHGTGEITGKALVKNKNINLISFTGSTKTGKWIATEAAKNLTRVSLELGGKNAIVIDKDIDIIEAIKWTILSSFSNAGQRCAASSRILVIESIYEKFVNELVKETKKLKVGNETDCDLGPVINKKQFKSILDQIEIAQLNGGKILCGGKIKENSDGYYIQPTLIHSVSPEAEILNQELFGPVAVIEKINNIDEAIQIINNSEYGLTSAIHTLNIDKAIWFAQNVRVGVVNVNMGTYGSEPHMPFGGFRNSGNGTREPGTESLDVYSELKNISYLVRLNNIND